MDPPNPDDDAIQPPLTSTRSISRLIPISSHRLASATKRFFQSSSQASKYPPYPTASPDLKTPDSEINRRKAHPCLLNIPVELRHQIWRETVGSKILHIRSPSHGEVVKIVCYECRSPRPRICEGFGRVRGCSKYPRADDTEENDMIRRQRISLILACKQIHDEVVAYFYTSTIFKTTSAQIIHSLPTCFPTHLPFVRSIFFTYPLTEPPVPPSDPVQYEIHPGLRSGIQSWTQTWRALASMRGLTRLRVKLRTLDAWYMTRWDEMTEDQISSLVLPIRLVDWKGNDEGERDGRGKWELLVTFECDLELEVWKSLPCRVRRVRRGGPA